MSTQRLTPLEQHDIEVLLYNLYPMPQWALEALQAISARRRADLARQAYAWEQHCKAEHHRIQRMIKDGLAAGDPFAELMAWPLDQIDKPRFAELCKIVFGEDSDEHR